VEKFQAVQASSCGVVIVGCFRHVYSKNSEQKNRVGMFEKLATCPENKQV
jgi:hypothetical protein